MADSNIPQANAPVDTPQVDAEGYYTVEQLKRQYYDYVGNKTPEIEEAKEARRYYHGAQWTDKEIKALKRRRQPVITSNRIVRKIDAVVGLVEKLKQDPKAYPRNPNSEQGAEVATSVLRYAVDHVDWNSKCARAARMAAIDGIGGVEIDLAYGDHGDPDIDVHLVYPDTFFYDPRSYDDGFTDARYLGISKWIDVEQAKELVPDKKDEIGGLSESGTDITTYSDREVMWVNTTAKKLRMVDHWYIHEGHWCWALYVGNVVLLQGHSPYIDERGKSFSKFLMFSSAVDHDGDRYGFVRNFKGPQDEINHRRSKALHILNSRRLVMDKGAVDDVEKARIEWARPDGLIEKNPGKEVKPEDQQADFAGQLQMLQEAKQEIENFGPNPALIGQGLEGSSGRAINLLQQAGIAELGPYIIAYRTWKMRVYRAIWNVLSRHWQAERWIRVTDDDGVAQFIQINGLTTDQYGQPAIANYLGSLDVDIIIDEGAGTRRSTDPARCPDRAGAAAEFRQAKAAEEDGGSVAGSAAAAGQADCAGRRGGQDRQDEIGNRQERGTDAEAWHRCPARGGAAWYRCLRSDLRCGCCPALRTRPAGTGRVSRRPCARGWLWSGPWRGLAVGRCAVQFPGCAAVPRRAAGFAPVRLSHADP
jgi:hypothetical protein